MYSSNGSRVGPPVKLRIAVEWRYYPLKRKLRVINMPVLAVFLFALVATPLAGLVIDNSDTPPPPPKYSSPYDIRLEIQPTMDEDK